MHLPAFTTSLVLAFATLAQCRVGGPREHYACNSSNLDIRREWSALPQQERKAYTDAVLCLQALAPRLNSTQYPGAKSRYDDFLAVHINMTDRIHLNGFFLAWHRGFVANYEHALRVECGYQGTQPYWDWPRWAGNLTASPLFNGGPYSLSGDGAHVANESDIVVGPNVTLPHANGGGCVSSGPFVNMTVSMGPFEFQQALAGGVLPNGSFAYNPRCLSRDLNDYIATRYTNYTSVSYLLSQPSIADFQGVMSGTPGTFDLGVHGGGHFTMGSIGSDFFASPGDPAFYLHHAQIDRVWALWQAQCPEERQYAVYGTQTILDIPPSPNVTLNDTLSWDVAGRDLKMRDLMDVRSGPFCYTYE